MELDFTIDQVIATMKKTKKTDPLFRPLKKLKTAIEGIGVTSVSLVPTNRIIVFHFGLGNQTDKQFIILTKPLNFSQQISIIPGHSYCILNFYDTKSSTEYIESKHRIKQRQMYFQDLQYQNIKRTLIFLYCKQNFLKETQLFPIDNCLSKLAPGCLPGLFLFQDIISKEEEANLAMNIDKGKWERLNNRRVQHYGYQFKYGHNQIDKDDKQGLIPQYMQGLLGKLKQIDILKHLQFDQLTINDYFAGNGIPAHFDTHSPFEEVFISVSLLSGIVMEFRKYNGQEQSVYLRQRSVAIFSGQARYAWTHGISSRKLDKIDNKIVYRSRRLSLTFRKIKFTPCKCPYNFYCDSQGYQQQTMKKNNPLLNKFLNEQDQKELLKHNGQEIEKQFVQKAYNGFGFDFHNKVIEQIRQYLEKQVLEAELVLDIGCGNGQYRKYTNQFAYYIGVQKCTVMVPVENQIFMDCRKLGIRSDSIDRIIFVAVLHHLASEQSRLLALSQIHRVLKVKGVLYLTVMSYEHKRQIYASQQTFLEYCLPSNKIKQGQQIQKVNPVQQPRRQQRGDIYKRYYHLFTVQQLGLLLQKSNFIIEERIISKQNIIIKAIKPE